MPLHYGLVLLQCAGICRSIGTGQWFLNNGHFIAYFTSITSHENGWNISEWNVYLHHNFKRESTSSSSNRFTLCISMYVCPSATRHALTQKNIHKIFHKFWNVVWSWWCLVPFRILWNCIVSLQSYWTLFTKIGHIFICHTLTRKASSGFPQLRYAVGIDDAWHLVVFFFNSDLLL